MQNYIENIYKFGDNAIDCPCSAVREIKHFTKDLVRSKNPDLKDQELKKLVSTVIDEAAKYLHKDPPTLKRKSLLPSKKTLPIDEEKKKIRSFIQDSIEMLMTPKLKAASSYSSMSSSSSRRSSYSDFTRNADKYSTPKPSPAFENITKNYYNKTVLETPKFTKKPQRKNIKFSPKQSSSRIPIYWTRRNVSKPELNLTSRKTLSSRIPITPAMRLSGKFNFNSQPHSPNSVDKPVEVVNTKPVIVGYKLKIQIPVNNFGNEIKEASLDSGFSCKSPFEFDDIEELVEYVNSVPATPENRYYLKWANRTIINDKAKKVESMRNDIKDMYKDIDEIIANLRYRKRL